MEWLAADYDTALILKWAKAEWKIELTRQAVSHHRQKYIAEIERLRTARHAEALNTGLALKEERVARLKRHADELEAVMWQKDDKGRPIYEDAWRKTLDDIAKEKGERKGDMLGGDGEAIKVYVNIDLDKV